MLEIGIVIMVLLLISPIVAVLLSNKRNKKDKITQKEYDNGIIISDEPEEWQNEFSDLEKVIKEEERKSEEIRKLNLSKAEQVNSQLCPIIRRVCAEFAKVIKAESGYSLPIELNKYASINSQNVICDIKIGSEYSDRKIEIRAYFDRVIITAIIDSDYRNAEEKCIDLKEFSDSKFANELKNCYIRMTELIKQKQ